MNTIRENKKYIITLSISVFCLIVIVFSVTYAYFTPFIKNVSKETHVKAGKVNLQISKGKINFDSTTPLKPILDTSKDTKAYKNEFTVSRTEDSNLSACYDLYLDVESIGTNLRNKYFKYELDYGSADNVISGDFSTVTLESDGTAKILLLEDQVIDKDNVSNTYTIRFWLSYDKDNDQTSLLTGAEETRKFQAHITASGYSGKCLVKKDDINNESETTTNEGGTTSSNEGENEI